MNTLVHSPRKYHYFAIGILSLSMIVVQILLSRIFSVALVYHFAFAAISFAMIGLAAGALKVHRNPERFTHETMDNECAMYIIKSVALLVFGTILMVDTAGRQFVALLSNSSMAGAPIMYVVIIISMICFVRAFVNLGVCITLLLTYFPAYTNRLYACDLVCAALGCIVVLLGLKLVDPISLIILLACVLSVLSWRLLENGTTADTVRQRVIGGALLLVFLMQFGSLAMGDPMFKLRLAKLEPVHRILYERWNSFSHVAVHPKLHKAPFGWGLGTGFKPHHYKGYGWKFIKIDASAGTPLTKVLDDVSRHSYLQYDVTNAAYHMRDIDHTAVIGVGGGRDILSALHFKTPKVTGIEINPTIFDILRKEYADYAGNLFTRPEVNPVNAEARSYINSRSDKYDLIQISLIDTWATTAAGGLTMTENKLYTKEAWVEFLTHLNDKGTLSVSRWFVPHLYRGALYRMVSLATAALKEIDPSADPTKHVIVVGARKVITMLVSRTPFTEEELGKLNQAVKKYGFYHLINPAKKFDSVTHTILSDQATDEFYDTLPLDVTAPTDDRPFFFNMTKITSIKSMLGKEGHATFIAKKNNVAVITLSLLIALVFGFALFYIVWPMVKMYRDKQKSFTGSVPFILYFSSIGLGFMFIEMSLMQSLIIFLGHPVYALSVILFTMLFFSGIGSYTVSYDKLSSRTYIIRPLALCILLMATVLIAAYFKENLAEYDTTKRVILSVILLIPISVFMGMMFPLGIALAKQNHTELLPWFWGLNGAASVFASVMSVFVAMNFGGSMNYKIGIVCYIICALICFLQRKRIA